MTPRVIICLVVGFIVQRVTSHRTSCPKYCVCEKSKKSMTCDGRQGRLKWIPRPPAYVQRFKLSNVDLQTLALVHIYNLTNCKITGINFVGNKISEIQPDVLEPLKHLRALHWQQKVLPLRDLELALKKLKSPLTDLTLQANRVGTTAMFGSSFQHLISLRTLTLNLREITSFNTSGLQYIVHLRSVNLNDNRLKRMHTDQVLPNVRALKLQRNNLVDIPTFCSKQRALIPRLQSLDLADNAIRDINLTGLLCLSGLQKLIISKNRIERLKNNTFANMRLVSIGMTALSSLWYVEDLVFNSSYLQKIMFNLNPVLNKRNSNPERWFMHTPNLKSLDMTSTKMRLTEADLIKFLLTLRNVEHLTLQRIGIVVLPINVLSKLTKLKRLTLTGNYFNSWDKDVFSNVTSIKTLIFDGCNINIINETSFPLEFRLSIKKIDLANNPFTCTCDLLWFRNWMKVVIANKSIEFLQYPHRYACRSPNTKYLHLADFNPTASSCAKFNVYTFVITVVLGVSVTFIAVGLVIYRYRWYIFYWISLIRRRRQHQDPERELKYDGFVSYSNHDADWMYEELLDYLEGEVGLILCEHSRDFVPGTYIVDNVFDAMDFSKKTILVISNEYMKSHWCIFELQMALDGFLKQELDIVVIVKEHIQACHVTSTLRALLTSVVYIEWSEEPDARRLFRERVVSVLH